MMGARNGATDSIAPGTRVGIAIMAEEEVITFPKIKSGKQM
jgi:hypothetical protein